MSSNARRRLIVVAGFLALAIALGFWLLRERAASTATNRSAGTPATSTATPPANSAPGAAVTAAAPGTTEDFRASLDRVRTLRDPRLHSREFGRLLRAWLERDPEAALAYVRSLPTNNADYTQGLLATLAHIGQREADRALTLARELSATREQLAIYSSLFAQFAQQNVSSAVQFLARVPAGEARENAIRALADVWVRSDLTAALAWARGLSEPADRNAALEVALIELAAKDPLQVIEIAPKSLDGPALERTVFNALQKLTATDPQGASGLVTLLPPGETQTLAAAEVARAFAARDVPAALAWAKTLPNDSVRWLATNRVLETWAATDPTAAGRYVLSLPVGRDQHEAAVDLASVLAGVNPQNAISWAQSLPAENTRPVALANIANAWAQRDPAAATHWVAEQSSGALATLAPQTPNAALSYWVLKDARAAQEFVQTLPSSSQSGAAEFVAPLLAQGNPTNALAWTQSLAAPEARDRATVAAYVRWHDNAPAAAEAWLAVANLPPQTKAQLQRAH